MADQLKELDRKLADWRWKQLANHIGISGKKLIHFTLMKGQGAVLGFFGVTKEQDPLYKLMSQGFIGMAFARDENNGITWDSDGKCKNVGSLSLQMLELVGKPKAELTYSNNHNALKVSTQFKDTELAVKMNGGKLPDILMGIMTLGSNSQALVSEAQADGNDPQQNLEERVKKGVDLLWQNRHSNFQYGVGWKFATPLFFAHAEGRTSCLEVGIKINPFDLRAYGGVLLKKSSKVKFKAKHNHGQKHSIFKLGGELNGKGFMELMGKVSLDTNGKVKILIGRKIDNTFLMDGIYQLKLSNDPTEKKSQVGLFFTVER